MDVLPQVNYLVLVFVLQLLKLSDRLFELPLLFKVLKQVLRKLFDVKLLLEVNVLVKILFVPEVVLLLV